MGNIGADKIDRDLSARRIYHQIHIFHWNGTQQRFITQYQRPHIAKSISKSDFYGANIGNIYIGAGVEKNYLIFN